MKKNLIFTCLFLLLPLTMVGQQKIWKEYSSLPIKKIVSIDFLNESTAYAIGDSCRLFKTIDGCKTWSEIAINIDVPTKMNVISAKDKIRIGCDSGIYMNTSDDGVKWTVYSNLSPDGKEKFNISKIFFTNNLMWMCGNSVAMRFFKTDNGYSSPIETKKRFPIPGLEGDNVEPSVLRYVTDNIGYFLVNDNGIGFLYKTTDGGDYWEPSTKSLPNNINKIHFFDENNWVGFGLGVFITSDAGKTWVQQSEKLFMYYNYDDFWFSHDECIVATANNIRRTTDCGKTWVDETTSLNLYSLKFPTNSNGEYFFSGNKIYKYVDSVTGITEYLDADEHLKLCVKQNTLRIDFKLNDADVIDVYCYNNKGVLLFNKPVTSNSAIDIATLGSGVYYTLIQGNARKFAKKFVLSK